MAIFQHAIDNTGEVLYTNLPKEAVPFMIAATEQSSMQVITISEKSYKSRFIKKSSGNLTIFVLSTDESHVNSSKIFKELVKISLETLKAYSDNKKQLYINHDNIVHDLSHNLTSLNSYMIQDLYALVPPHILNKNINSQHDALKEIIQKQPHTVVTTILSLLRNNLAMKAEFSVFEKTGRPNPTTEKSDLPIRDVILSVLQIFIQEFEANKITVSIDSSTKSIYGDNESIFVSFYFLLQNAVKYCVRGSDLKIYLKDEQDYFAVTINMVSVHIAENEKDKLCDKNFRAESAIALTPSGKGIGMFRLKKALRMNDAEIEIIPRATNYSKTVNGILFENNHFKIKFLGQGSWFREI